MASLKLRFRAVDSLFFREMRPHGGPGGQQLQSVFPPPTRTLDGAVRMLLHEANGIPLLERMGRGASPLDTLRMRGPYLVLELNGEYQRLLPWPSHILVNEHGKRANLAPSMHAVMSDIGKVRMPELQTDERGFYSRRDTWITENDFYKLLADEQYMPSQIFTGEGELYVREPRLGIARNHQSRSAEEGMLYQTSHIRPIPELAFDVEVFAPVSRHNGLADSGAAQSLQTLRDALSSGAVVRLGAEGHSAHVSVVTTESDSEPVNHSKSDKALIVFKTHADFGASWFPSNFSEQKNDLGSITWRGFADAATGIDLEIISAINGKYLREGGWDSVNDCPRSARALVPAGSVWFCQVHSGDVRQLQGIGVGRELGRGEIAIGNWKERNT